MLEKDSSLTNINISRSFLCNAKLISQREELNLEVEPKTKIRLTALTFNLIFLCASAEKAG